MRFVWNAHYRHYPHRSEGELYIFTNISFEFFGRQRNGFELFSCPNLNERDIECMERLASIRR